MRATINLPSQDNITCLKLSASLNFFSLIDLQFWSSFTSGISISEFRICIIAVVCLMLAELWNIRNYCFKNENFSTDNLYYCSCLPHAGRAMELRKFVSAHMVLFFTHTSLLWDNHIRLLQ